MDPVTTRWLRIAEAEFNYALLSFRGSQLDPATKGAMYDVAAGLRDMALVLQGFANQLDVMNAKLDAITTKLQQPGR
jgi:hypothetical protein